MAGEQQRMRDEVSEATTVMGSAGVLIRGFATRLQEVAEQADGVTKATLTEWADELNTNADALAADVAANTVADDEVPAALKGAKKKR